MKALRNVLLAAAVCAVAVPAAAQTHDSTVIGRFIASEVRRLGGEEYREARKIVTGDLNGDGRADAAVLYTIEGAGGGNNYAQFLAVFVRDEEGQLAPAAHASAGGKLYREAHLVSITDGAVLLNVVNYAEKDAACCPSKKGTTRYTLVDGKLVEQK